MKVRPEGFLVGLLAPVLFWLTACSSSSRSDADSGTIPKRQDIASAVRVETCDGFPLSAGTYWIYRGTVKWTPATSTSIEVREELLNWKMEIVRSARVGPYEVARLKGHPDDLAWYVPGKPRGDYLIVRDDKRYYLLRLLDPGKELEALMSDRTVLEARLNSYTLFLDLPLRKDIRFAEDPDAKRDDILYCWYVEKESRLTLDGVRGFSHKSPVVRFSLSYRSLPDHTFVDFVPGIGIMRYVYGHHGTASETDLQLVEYHPGRSP